jgi:hypothetical protein
VTIAATGNGEIVSAGLTASADGAGGFGGTVGSGTAPGAGGAGAAGLAGSVAVQTAGAGTLRIGAAGGNGLRLSADGSGGDGGVGRRWSGHFAGRARRRRRERARAAWSQSRRPAAPWSSARPLPTASARVERAGSAAAPTPPALGGSVRVTVADSTTGQVGSLSAGNTFLDASGTGFSGTGIGTAGLVSLADNGTGSIVLGDLVVSARGTDAGSGGGFRFSQQWRNDAGRCPVRRKRP